VPEPAEGARRPDGPARVEPGWRPSAREVAAFVIIVLILVFALVNLEDGRIDFVFTQVTIPIFFVIVVPAFVGFLGGVLFQHRRDRRPRR